MVQINILSGKKAGLIWSARRFPVRIGRSPSSHLQLEEQGIWDDHAEISLNAGEGFVLNTKPNALVATNGQPVQRAVLRNGDIIEIGSAKIQFWLAAVLQRGSRFRESLVWVIVAMVFVGELALVLWLKRE